MLARSSTERCILSGSLYQDDVETWSIQADEDQWPAAQIMSLALGVTHLTDPFTGNVLFQSDLTEENIFQMIYQYEDELYRCLAMTKIRIDNGQTPSEAAGLAIHNLEHGRLKKILASLGSVIHEFARSKGAPSLASEIQHFIKNVIVIAMGNLEMIAEGMRDPTKLDYLNRNYSQLDARSVSGLLNRMEGMNRGLFENYKRRHGIRDAEFKVDLYKGSTDFDSSRRNRPKLNWRLLRYLLQELVWNACKYGYKSLKLFWDPIDECFVIQNDIIDVVSDLNLTAQGVRGSHSDDVEGTGYGLSGLVNMALQNGWELSYSQTKAQMEFRLSLNPLLRGR